MKKILFFIVAMVVISNGLLAQQKQQPAKTAEERAEKIFSKMNEALELKEEQKLKVKDIILIREQARDNDRKNLSANKEELRKANEMRNEEREANLQANLSPQQYAKLLELRDQKKKQRHLNKEKNQPVEDGMEDL